jgi:isoleucyl-tRNA synthetase
VVQALQTFCSEDLGGFYLDILKDRLYTTAPKSAARRSAQSALWHITQSFVRLLAPITSFTAEEVWAVLTGKDDDSVMFQQWHELPAQAGEGELLARWTLVRSARADVTKALEAQREAGKIGSALQAAVEIRCAGDKYAALAALGDDLKFVLICSATTLVRDETEQVVATPLDHAKCERCWHVREDVGANVEHPTLCGRCVSNLYGGGEARTCA